MTRRVGGVGDTEAAHPVLSVVDPGWRLGIEVQVRRCLGVVGDGGGDGRVEKVEVVSRNAGEVSRRHSTAGSLSAPD
jgi:hypothetical protein